MKQEWVAFFLAAITIQSGRNVCGTKWSVMGNRLLQLHSEGQKRQQIGQRRTGSKTVQRQMDGWMDRWIDGQTEEWGKPS